jgi:ketosteroid isomerase-like protein
MSYSDREQIQHLMAVYAHALDNKDYDGVTDCFAADAVIRYEGHSDTLTGQPKIYAHMRGSLEKLDATQHMFSNFLIDIAGDTARLKCDVLAQHVRNGAEGQQNYLAGGKYSVELKKIQGSWKFSRVHGRSVWREGNVDLLPKADN